MSFFFIWIALIIATIDWFAVAKKWKALEYIAKPGVMLTLLAWFWINNGINDHTLWFALGITFSLAGDVFLMLPREQFVAGLVAFLLGHLAYLVGLNPTLPPWNLAGLILAFFVGITALQIYRRVAHGLLSSGLEGLKTPVLAYTIVISLMLLSALLTLVRPTWDALPALMVSSGALLFFISDTLLAWNKFIAKLPYGSLITITTYHLGQMGIVVGAMLHYLP